MMRTIIKAEPFNLRTAFIVVIVWLEARTEHEDMRNELKFFQYFLCYFFLQKLKETSS